MTWWPRRCRCAEEMEAIESAIHANTIAVENVVLQFARLNKQLAALIGGADRPRFMFTVGPTRPKEEPMFAVESTIEEKVKISISPRTSQGNPAELDGPVSVEILGDGTATFQMIDNQAFYIISGDSPGVTVYLISADADLGEGVQTIQETIEYTVVDALATNLGISAGAPEPK